MLFRSTPDHESAGLKSVVVESQGPDDSGFTTFYAQEDEVKRFRCPASVLAEGSDQQPVDDPKFLRAKCVEAPSTTGNKVTVKVLEAKLKSVYLTAVDDQNLTI